MTIFLIQQQANIHHRFFSCLFSMHSTCVGLCCCLYLFSSLSPLSQCSFFQQWPATHRIAKLHTFTMGAAQSECNNSLLLLGIQFLVEGHLHSHAWEQVFLIHVCHPHFQSQSWQSRQFALSCVCTLVCVFVWVNEVLYCTRLCSNTSVPLHQSSPLLSV